MAIDEGTLSILCDDLGDRPNLTEKRMFGGLCFMLAGNMLCGTLKDGAVYRVGKDNQETALAVPGAAMMTFTGRRMGGFVELRGTAFGDDGARQRLLDLALTFVDSLPPK